MVILTEELIEQLRTPAGGFNMKAMEAIGAWPLSTGWEQRLVGTSVSDANWKRAMKAKDEKRHFYRGNTRRR